MKKEVKRLYPIVPLEKEELERITEINFYMLISHLLDRLGNIMLLNKFLADIAVTMTLSPDMLVAMSTKILQSESMPPLKEELIEIYYRSEYTRRAIFKLCKTNDRRVTDVIKREKSYIVPAQLSEVELKFAKAFMTFFSDATEAML